MALTDEALTASGPAGKAASGTSAATTWEDDDAIIRADLVALRER
jgi:hypothetical protein